MLVYLIQNLDISQLPVEREVVLERLGAWTGCHATKEEPILEDRQVLSEIHLGARADLELFIAAGPPAQEEEIVIDAWACPVAWTACLPGPGSRKADTET